MAKTTSQIIAENKKKRAEEAAIDASRGAIHQRQMAEVGAKSAARTAAILNKAGFRTRTDPNTYEVSVVQDATPRKKETAQRLEVQKKKEDRLEAKTAIDSAQIKKDRAEKAMAEHDEKDFDATSAQARKQHDARRKQLEQEAAQAGAEMAAREEARIQAEDREAIDSMSQEDKARLEQYAVNQVRDQNLPIEMQGMMPTARQEAGDLFAKVGQKRADELAETYMRDENAALAEAVEATGRQLAQKSPVLASAATIPANLMGAIAGTVGQLQGAARRTGRYTTLDANETGTALEKFSGAVRGQVAENIEGEDPGLLRKGASFLYQGGMSFLDSTARMLASGGSSGISSAIAAMGGFSSALQKYSAMGASPEKAAQAAVVSAGLEYITEKLPTDQVLKLFHKGGKDPGVVKSILQQAFLTEPASEEVNLFAGIAAEALILGDQSGKNQRIGDLIANGASREEAEAQFWKETMGEALQTYAVSAVAGGLGAGGAVMAGKQVQAGQEQQAAPFAPGVQPAAVPAEAMQQPAAPQTEAEQLQQAMEATDVERGAPPRLIQTSDGGNAKSTSDGTSADAYNMTATANSPHTGDRETVTPVGGQIKGTGAAESNFSAKPAYNATLSEDNAQPDRAGDVRPMELPQYDVNGRRISAITGNVYGSRITPDDFASLMEEPTAKGDFSYAKITNDQATQRATETIASAGTWENAYDSWKQSVTVGNAGAEMSARGALFLNHAAQQGNKQLWLETLHYMQKLGTNTAQGLQAFRIIRTLKPVDKIEFVKMSVEKMATEVREKHGIDLEIDQTLIDEFEQAETDADRDAVLEDIQQNVADQIPSTFLDKWTALRYMNMLGNLKTNVRNVAGNIGSATVYRIKDTIATGMETIASKLSDGSTERTKSLFVRKSLLNACKEDFQQFKETVSSGGKYGERMSATSQFEQGVQDKRRIFKNSALEAYRRGTNWMMNNEHFGDEAFGRAAYSRALAGYLQANGVTGSDLSEVDGALLDKARAYAIKEAQEATFHDNSALAKIVSKVQKDTGILGQGIMPFTKTPANVLTRAEEFSPLGLINSTVKSIQKARGNENITGADVINSWAKSVTGVGLFALGAAMMDQGLLAGGPDEDEEKAAFDELNGQQNYAIRLPDGTNYTIDWLTPAAMPMFMGAQFWKLLSSDRDLTFADMEQVFTSIADPMIQMSMLQGLNDSLDNIKYSENNLGQFFLNAAMSYLTQGLTNTLMGQLERSTEENRQTTFVDKDSAVPQWIQRQLGKASQKIPGWDYQQAEYRNAWGQTEENEGGLLYNLLSPGYISTQRADELSQELYRLRETTGANVFPQAPEKTISYLDNQGKNHVDYNLSQQELETLQTTTGETASRILNELTQDPNYQALTDNQKAKAIQEVYSYAKQTGEIAAVPDHHGYSDSWMKGLERGDEAATILQRAAVSSVSNAVSDLNTAWAEGWETRSIERDLQESYDVYQGLDRAGKRAVMDAADSGARNYIQARSGGISHEVYINTVKAIATLKPEPGDKNPNQIQKMETIAKQRGLTEQQRVLVAKLYGSDAQDKNIEEVKALGYDYTMYAKLYRDHEDYTRGNGKKRRTISHWQQKYGFDYRTAKALYEVFS